MLLAFYNSNIRTQAEIFLSSSNVGDSVTFPQDGSFIDFPRAEASNLFQSLSKPWVSPSTQIIGDKSQYNDILTGMDALIASTMTESDLFDNFDAFAAIGRGRVLNPRFQFVVTKEDDGILTHHYVYHVTAVNFRCTIADLYDFNFEDGQLPKWAATLQLGYGRGMSVGDRSSRGKIFRHQILIDSVYANAFDYHPAISP